MSERRRRRKNTEEGGSEDSSDESIQDKLLYSDQGSEGANSEYESADEEEIHAAGAAPTQSEPTEEEQKLDDDEDRKNPQYIPKRGGFYEHDDRTMPEDEEQTQQPTEGVDGEQRETPFPGANLPVVPISATSRSESEDPRPDSSKPIKKRVWKGDSEKWSHDKFEEVEQAPKAKEEIVTAYGYDIRTEEGAPRARRRRRYGRGPNKYTRCWEDLDAYSRTPPARGGGALSGRGPRRGGRGANRPPPTMENQQEFPSLGETERSRREEDQTMNLTGDQDNNRRAANRGHQQDFQQPRSTGGNSANRQNNNPLQGQPRSEHGPHTYTNQEYRSKGKESRGRGERGARRRGGDRGGRRGRGANYEEDYPPQFEQQQQPLSEGRPSPTHRGQSSPSHGRGDFKKGGYPPHTPQYSSPQHSSYGGTSQKRYSSSRPSNNPVSPTGGFSQAPRHVFYQGSTETSPQNLPQGEHIGTQGLVNPPSNPIAVQSNPVMETPSAHVYEYSNTQRQAVPLPATLPSAPHQFVPPVTFGAPPPTAYFAAVPHPPQTLATNTPMIRPPSNFIPPTEHSAPIAMNPQPFQAQPGSGAPLHPPQYSTYHPPPGYVPPVEQTPPTVPHPASSGQANAPTEVYRNGVMYYNTQSQQPPVSAVLPKRPKAAIPILPPPELSKDDDSVVNSADHYALQQLELQKQESREEEGGYQEEGEYPEDGGYQRGEEDGGYEQETREEECYKQREVDNQSEGDYNHQDKEYGSESQEALINEPDDTNQQPEGDEKLKSIEESLDKVQIGEVKETEDIKAEKTQFSSAIESTASLDSKHTTEL